MDNQVENTYQTHKKHFKTHFPESYQFATVDKKGVNKPFS
jgi:hypothetical protein